MVYLEWRPRGSIKKYWHIVLLLLIVICLVALFWSSPTKANRHTYSGSLHTAMCHRSEEALPNSCSNNESGPIDRPQLQSQWNHELGYIATMKYGGQQGAGVLSILNQQCFAGSRFNILEPVMAASGFGAMAEAADAVRFSDLFDLSHFNNVSSRLGFSQLLSRERFFQHAKKKIIIIKLVKSDTERANKVTWRSENGSFCCQKNPATAESKKITWLLEKGFCVVSIITIGHRGSQCITERDFQMIFSDWRVNEVTTVFEMWRYNVWKLPTYRCRLDQLVSIRPHLKPSPVIVKDANLYKKMLWKSGTRTVSVMFRFERLALKECKKKSETKRRICIDHCVQNAIDTVKTLQAEIPGSNVFVTMDIGKYASVTINKSLHRNFMSIGKDIIQTLIDHTLTFEKWEEKFAKISLHKGYIAALQRYIASEADCLVLVGGGYFQELALTDYVRNHKEMSKCTHFVCAMKTDNLEQIV